jgi:hypothetical protein
MIFTRLPRLKGDVRPRVLVDDVRRDEGVVYVESVDTCREEVDIGIGRLCKRGVNAEVEAGVENGGMKDETLVTRKVRFECLEAHKRSAITEVDLVDAAVSRAVLSEVLECVIEACTRALVCGG